MHEENNIPGGANLENWSKDPWENGVEIDRLEDLEKLAVQTTNNLYKITIIGGRRGEILVRGGKFEGC